MVDRNFSHTTRLRLSPLVLTDSVGVNWIFSLCCIILILSVFAPSHVEAMPGPFLCNSQITCLNGGTLVTPDNPFDFCRCHCPKRFAGLHCEFTRKVQRNDRLKRLVRIKNEIAAILNQRHLRR
ncbi:hypothetical protein DPMN_178145 [Dreissena polymorpha]|uniref:EGF-like domain-containing protein n=1 Tax=Dreissena polymorpha TaxID=45954 RepID=A0A9D4ECB9_DREPO|nr:hypothetical protein DPMN_178145 [Dreissena polymorpha]